MNLKKFRVMGTTTVTVTTTVCARNAEDAIKIASQAFEGINSYAGNGGLDKLIGVEGDNDTIEADDSVIFDDAMPES